MRIALAVLAGRLTRWLTRLRGGGSAFPGKVVRAIAPRFLARAVSRLPQGVVFVSGSNGKSTTTHMVVGMLRAHGLKVFSNPAGGNLPQGIASAVLADVPLDGVLRHDIAVLEVDEAFGGALARELQPHSVLLLNIQVDQLNRFHEPARVATMLEAFAKTATRALVVNGDDRNLRALAGRLASGPAVQSFFAVAPEVLEAGSAWLASGDNPLLAQAGEPVDARVVVESASGRSAVLSVDGERVDVRLPARGLHYAVDAAGATALTAALLGERLDLDAVASGLADMAAVFGRGEILRDRKSVV